jgi:arylsulfatase A-like enzyme
MRVYVTYLILSSTMVFNLACKRLNPPKPNIIFILTDDQRWDALGYAGNNIVQTPEMDRLAQDGVFFKNAFVTTPICAASRASILTGMYERTHGYTFGQETIKEPYIQNSYPALMKNSDYYTGFFGKFGVKYDSIDSLFDVNEVYDRNTNFKDYRGYYYKTFGEDTVHLTRYTGQKALDFIAEAPVNRPFCLSLSFSAPHAHDPALDQYFWQKEVDSLYEELTIPSPILSEDKYFLAQPDYVRNGINRTRWYWRFDTPEKYQHSMKGYYRMITGVDIEIGKIRKLLADKGIDDNTVIILMGDNGYFEGERQLAGKWLMYDNCLKVPMLIYDPRKQHHRDIEDMVLNIDITSTIMDYAGLPIPMNWQGKSLASYTKGENPLKDRKEFLCEHLWEIKIIPSSEGIRSKNWKYFRYRNDLKHEELYNLDVDPLEIVNLAGTEKYQDKLKEMRTEFEKFAANLVDQKLIQ